MTRIAKKDDSCEVRHVTWVGLGWNAALSAGKFFAGFFGGSQALVADAIHSASDFITDIAIIVGSKFWNLPPDEQHPYGHRRFETLISVGIGLAVCAVGIGLGYNAVRALINGEQSHPEWIAAIMAAVSIVVKEILFRYTRNAGRRIRSQVLEANAWHHRSDAFSSIPVLVAVVFAILLPQLWFADSVGALIVAFFIMHSAIEIAWPGLRQLVDYGASADILEKLKREALSHPKVISLHGFRSRYVGSDLHVDVHIVVDDQMTLKDAHDVAEEVEQLLIDSGENVVDAMVHIDPYNAKRAAQNEIKTIEK
jgi:cation diffusion facilitator family transporter